MLEILNSTKVLRQHLGCNFPKLQLKATCDLRQWLKISRSTHFLANFTIEKIGNERGP